MLLPDVNILVYAYRTDSPEHLRYKQWFDDFGNDSQAFGMATLVLSRFLRIVTNPAAFRTPAPIADALAFVAKVLDQPNCVVLAPGVRHWEIFAHLCQTGGIRGNLVPDAYLAALAIESGSEWITTDGDFARFPGLRWRRPF